MQFSLFYFSSKFESGISSPYSLLWSGAKFADENGFAAIWTPERHFDEFGAPFPSPAITTAALSTITNNIQLRAGSLVLPLHNPMRVAEEWAMLDHFSKGRIGISVASGWHAQDFSLEPSNYVDRKKIMLESLAVIKKLWGQQGYDAVSGDGTNISVQTFPPLFKQNIPIWFAASGNPQTFELAADHNAGVLTHLLDQDIDVLKLKIKSYRERLKKNGDWKGHVTLMLHTFIGSDMEATKNLVRPHLKSYFATAMNLEAQQKQYAEKFDDENITPEDIDIILEYATDRFYMERSLIGTIDHCAQIVEKIRQIGVDEIACFIDFGVEQNVVMKNLTNLNILKENITASQHTVE
ncbi:MAG: LLM class flavin-dependent oxidoreductase [Gammaproteobacteria bacterium]|nr:LLM class flavin-dependent oxidoreductase [Gammaproteobacteria bacterium]